jgi:hypothetical protein
MPWSLRCARYSTSPCSVPASGSGQPTCTVRAYRSPAFSRTRRDRVLTAMVVATSSSMPRLVNARPASARAPSVAYPSQEPRQHLSLDLGQRPGPAIQEPHDRRITVQCQQPARVSSGEAPQREPLGDEHGLHATHHLPSPPCRNRISAATRVPAAHTRSGRSGSGSTCREGSAGAGRDDDGLGEQYLLAAPFRTAFMELSVRR